MLSEVGPDPQLLAVERIVEVRGILPVVVPLPSGAVELVDAAAMHLEDVVIIHVDGSATPERGRTIPVTQVLRDGC